MIILNLDSGLFEHIKTPAILPEGCDIRIISSKVNHTEDEVFELVKSVYSMGYFKAKELTHKNQQR